VLQKLHALLLLCVCLLAKLPDVHTTRALHCTAATALHACAVCTAKQRDGAGTFAQFLRNLYYLQIKPLCDCYCDLSSPVVRHCAVLLLC
jgi:hypothetical protein